MNFGVQGLNSTAHHFWKARVSGYFLYSDPSILQRLKGTSSGQ